MKNKLILDCPCVPLIEADVECILMGLIEDNMPGYTVAINAEKILRYSQDHELRKVIDESVLPYPDGSGAVLGLRWLHGQMSEKINMPIKALEIASKFGLKTFIIGAKPDVHLEAVNVIKNCYKGIDLIGHLHGYNEFPYLMEEVVKYKPDLVMLALGSPRQEKFAAKLVENLDKGIIIGCGGALDIIANRLKRAPKFLIDNNLEWAYRVIQEPWRLRRQLFLPEFLFSLIMQTIKKKLEVFKN